VGVVGAQIYSSVAGATMKHLTIRDVIRLERLIDETTIAEHERTAKLAIKHRVTLHNQMHDSWTIDGHPQDVAAFVAEWVEATLP
jgi:hypothetical protein